MKQPIKRAGRLALLCLVVAATAAYGLVSLSSSGPGIGRDTLLAICLAVVAGAAAALAIRLLDSRVAEHLPEQERRSMARRGASAGSAAGAALSGFAASLLTEETLALFAIGFAAAVALTAWLNRYENGLAATTGHGPP